MMTDDSDREVCDYTFEENQKERQKIKIEGGREEKEKEKKISSEGN